MSQLSMFEHEDRLAAYMHVFYFNVESLTHNREGNLSPKQLREMRANRWTAYTVGLFLLIILGFGILSLVENEVTTWRIHVPIMVLAGVITYWLLVKQPALWNREVVSACVIPISAEYIALVGSKTNTFRRFGRRVQITRYFYNIGPKRFVLDEQTHMVLEKYPPETIYLSRWSKQLLSVE